MLKTKQKMNAETEKMQKEKQKKCRKSNRKTD